MMSIFGMDPLKKLQKKYERKLIEVRDIQRSGNIQRLAAVSVEAAKMLKEIETIKSRRNIK